jgi:preprotein translocase subunit SecF
LVLVRGLGLSIIFGILDETSSSIFIAPPILPFLRKKRLRPTLALESSSAPGSTGDRRIAGATNSS